jgi:hypothetical protein
MARKDKVVGLRVVPISRRIPERLHQPFEGGCHEMTLQKAEFLRQVFAGHLLE